MSSTGGPVNGSMGLLSRSVAVASPAATRTRPHPEGVDQCVEPALRVSAGKGESVGKVAVLFASAVNVLAAFDCRIAVIMSAVFVGANYKMIDDGCEVGVRHLLGVRGRGGAVRVRLL